MFLVPWVLGVLSVLIDSSVFSVFSLLGVFEAFFCFLSVLGFRVLRSFGSCRFSILLLFNIDESFNSFSVLGV